MRKSIISIKINSHFFNAYNSNVKNQKSLTQKIRATKFDPQKMSF